MIKFIEVSFLKTEMQEYMQRTKNKCSVDGYARMGEFYDFVCKTIENCQKELNDRG